MTKYTRAPQAAANQPSLVMILKYLHADNNATSDNSDAVLITIPKIFF